MAETKAKTSGAGLAVLIAVAAAGFYLVNRGNPNRIPEDDDLSEVVSVLVEWSPTPRDEKNPVHIMLDVDGLRVADELATHSSFERTITIPRGAKVGVFAQQDYAGNLKCVILSANGKTLVMNDRTNGGSVRCFHNR